MLNKLDAKDSLIALLTAALGLHGGHSVLDSWDSSSSVDPVQLVMMHQNLVDIKDTVKEIKKDQDDEKDVNLARYLELRGHSHESDE